LIDHKNIHRLIYRNFLPRLWQDKIDLTRGESQVFRPCFQETKSIFIHIPKAAGTSIARAIYGINVGHRKASDYIRISKKEFYSYYRFSFVRNPWDRVFSAYNFAKQGGTKLVQPIPSTVYRSSAFESFETFISEWLIEADLSKEDVVFEPQSTYIYDTSENLLVDHIGKIETFSKDIAVIEDHLKISIDLQNLNQSNRKFKDYREAFNDKTAEIVSKIYSKDIKLFNYKF
jgi:hypothetical protein